MQKTITTKTRRLPLRLTFAPLFILLLLSASSFATDIYVSPQGNDENQGTEANPIATFGRAVEMARSKAGKQTITVHFMDGVYYLPETVVFETFDSGTAENPIVYKSVNEGGAVLSGGSELKLEWEPYQDGSEGIFQAKTPAGLAIDQLFINGQNQRMARYPNYDPKKKAKPYQGYAADAFSKAKSNGWSDPTGGFIHAMHRSRWGGYHYRITGKNAKGVTYEGGWQNNRKSGMHKEFRMVENIFEELDAPHEWYHNTETNTLYYKPEADIDLAQATVEVVRLRHLVEFKGTSEAPIEFITLQGFTVRHAARTFMDCKEPMVRSDWAIYRGGAFMLTGTHDVSILDCEFDQVGGNAIFVNNYNRRALVKGCHIHDTGASGVCFVGDPNALHNPLFEYGEKNDLSKIDRTVGPKTRNFPAQSAVEDCLITGIGRVERQPAGVQIEMAARITVRDCSIYDCARAGINIGDGAFGGHLIERCDVFDTVLETHDHGSFNSWGRDRFWRSDRETSQAAIDEDPNLPFLDAHETTVICNSRWRCDHGWDIDLDDGSNNYDLYNNLMLNSGLKLREGFRRHAWNNVAPIGALHPHVWFKRSGDKINSNIFLRPHQFARMNGLYDEGGTSVDRNLFFSKDKSILQRAAQRGWGANSQLGDPMYVDPANGDFRVKDGSPALELGFKNFPMDQFGVKKAKLKAIAKTPEIPSLENVKFSDRDAGSKTADGGPFWELKHVWLGATLSDLKGQDFSAYGVSKEDGGVALSEVPNGIDLKDGDLIQGVNGNEVKNIDQLFKSLNALDSEPIKLAVVRDQKTIELTIQPTVFVKVRNLENDNIALQPTNLAIETKPKTNNESPSILGDAELDENYGPVFGNGIRGGMYRTDLGSSQLVSAVSSWSHSYNDGARGSQLLTIYGSNAESDPGWNLSKFKPLGTIKTGPVGPKFTVASLRATDGHSLGTFRYVIWVTSPINNSGGGENTAFQELVVEVRSDEDAPSIPFRMPVENEKSN